MILRASTAKFLAAAFARKFKYQIIIYEKHHDGYKKVKTWGAIVTDKNKGTYVIVRKGRQIAYFPGYDWIVDDKLYYIRDANQLLHPVKPAGEIEIPFEKTDEDKGEKIFIDDKEDEKTIILPIRNLLKLPPPEWVKWYASQLREGMEKFRHESFWQRHGPAIVWATIFIAVGVSIYMILSGATKFTAKVEDAMKMIDAVKALRPPG